MKRICFLLLSSMAFGQGVILPPQQALKVVNGVTSPLPNATITVCAANTSGIPCAPALTSALFKDAALTQPLTNPFLSDSSGNYVFAITPGNYTVTVTGLGFAGYSYQTTAPLSASANNTFTANNTFSGNNSFSGSNTFSGTNGFTGQTSINPFQHNFTLWVGNAAPYKYTTLETALAAPECPATGCRVVMVTGFRENVPCTSSSVVIGNATGTPRYIVEGQPDVTLTATGAGGSIPCFIIKEGSGFQGASVGAVGGYPGRTEGFNIVDNRTGTVGPLIQSDVNAGANGQGSIQMRNLFINGCFANCTYTSPAAVVDIEQVLNQSIFENIKVCCASNATEFRLSGGPTREEGPILLQNLWTDCGLATGCQNLVIRSAVGTTSGSMLPVDVVGGNMTGPGPNQAAITVDGSAVAAAQSIKGIRIHTFIDNSGGSSANSAIGIKIIDSYNVDVGGTVMLAQNNDTMVDISETAVNKTAGIHASPINCTSPANGCKPINNHISGYNPGGGISEPFYNYGTVDSGLAGQVYSATFDGNKLLVGSTGPASAQLHVISNASITNGLEIDDTEASGKNVVFGPGTFSVGAVSLLDKTDSNTQLFSCTLATTGGCVIPQGGLSFVEQSSDPAGIASRALLSANSTTHTLRGNYNNGGAFSIPQTIASGTAAMTTAAIAAGACGTTVTVAAANVATTDTITWAFNAAPGGQNAGLVAWPTSGNVNFAYCSNTAETPAAATINWRVMR